MERDESAAIRVASDTLQRWSTPACCARSRAWRGLLRAEPRHPRRTRARAPSLAAAAGLKVALLGLLVALAGVVAVLVITEEQRRRRSWPAPSGGPDRLMVFDLRDKLAPIGRLDLLRDVQDRIDAYYEHLGVDADDLAIHRRRWAALTNKGDTLLARGDLVRRLRGLCEANRIAERLAAADRRTASGSATSR